MKNAEDRCAQCDRWRDFHYAVLDHEFVERGFKPPADDRELKMLQKMAEESSRVHVEVPRVVLLQLIEEVLAKREPKRPPFTLARTNTGKQFYEGATRVRVSLEREDGEVAMMKVVPCRNPVVAEAYFHSIVRN